MAGVATSRPASNLSNIVASIWAVLICLLALGLLGYGLYAVVGSLGLSDPSQGYPQLVLGLVSAIAGLVILRRYARLLSAIFGQGDYKRARATMRIDLIQLFLLLMLAIILFPVVWIMSMSLDPRDFSRPTGLTIIPPGASLDSYRQVLTKPSPNPVSFFQLLRNSLLVAGGTAIASVVIGSPVSISRTVIKSGTETAISPSILATRCSF